MRAYPFTKKGMTMLCSSECMTQADMLQSGWAAIVWLVAAIQVCIHSSVEADNNTLTVIPEIQYAMNGSYANFTCTPKVRPSGYYWLINGQAANGDHTVVQRMLEEVGYIFYNSDTQLMVSIPAREMTNNTAVRCRGLFEGYSNNTARLIVVYPTPPLAPQPLLTIKDHGSSTSSIIIIVRWFQPSLWSESVNQVDYYNITVIVEGEHNEYIEEHAIINYTNETGSLNYTTIYSSSVECSQISIQISAVNRYGSSNRTLARSIPKSPGTFPPGEVEVLTYFDSRGTPVILINTMPPKLCSFQQFNYSIIIISDGSGNEVLRIGPKEGQTTDNVIQEKITSGLDRDAQYAARVEIETEQGNSISEDIAFSTHLDLNNGAPVTATNCSNEHTDKALYLSVMGASIGVCTFILLSVIVALMICILSSRHGNRENSRQMQANKPLSNMVQNPIYDGPIYESMIQDFNTLQTSTNETLASAQTNDTKPQESPPPPQTPPDNNSVRYLDEPIQPSTKVDLTRRSSGEGFGSTTRSASVSVPSRRTPQERNKFQLTLSLGGTAGVVPSNNVLDERKNCGYLENEMVPLSVNGRAMTINHPIGPRPPKSIPAIAAVINQDDNYTVMSPVRAHTTMLGSLENGFGVLSPEDTVKYQE